MLLCMPMCFLALLVLLHASTRQGGLVAFAEAWQRVGFLCDEQQHLYTQ